MTPAARFAAAIEILDVVQRGDAPTRDVMAGYFRKRRYAGSKDRAAVRAHVYDTVRDLARLKWYLATIGADTDSPRNWILGACLLNDIDPLEIFTGERYAPPSLSADETASVAAFVDVRNSKTVLPEAAMLGCPAWLEEQLRTSLGDAFATELTALNQTASVDLRVDVSRTDRAAVIRKLAAEDIVASPTRYSPAGLRLDIRPELQRLTLTREGLIEPQDEGSQLLAYAVGAVPGQRIVDYCAGAGGKTMALASAMAGQGQIVACDISAARLRRMKPRLERAGVAAMVEFHELSEDSGGSPLPPGSADRVLVDAPCSGTGTWRRHPFQRWRLTPGDLENYIGLQRDILDAAAELVCPGGRLVYATCSLLDAENRDQSDRFLAAQNGFFRVPSDQYLPAELPGDVVTLEGDLRMTPARHGTDGVYAAVFERKAA